MQKKLPKTITKEEFEKIWVAMKKSKYTYRKEIMAAMILGFEAGMRISEIVGYKNKIKPLTRQQVEPASIKVIGGKGGKDRIVPRPKRFNETAMKLLPLDISRRTIQRQVTKLGKEVLNKEITFHTLRHGFGSHLAQNRPLHEVQMLMGHTRLDTTGIYLHANPKKAVDAAREEFS